MREETINKLEKEERNMYEFPSDCRGCKYKKICKTLPKDLTCLEVAIIAEQDEKDQQRWRVDDGETIV